MKADLRKRIEEIVYPGLFIDEAETRLYMRRTGGELVINKLLVLFSEVMEEVIGFEYRSKWQRGGWEKGEHGYKVKWYGQGYDNAIREARQRLGELLK